MLQSMSVAISKKKKKGSQSYNHTINLESEYLVGSEVISGGFRRKEIFSRAAHLNGSEFIAWEREEKGKVFKW